MSQWLETIPSSSNPGKDYHIIQGNDGVVYCDCPRWRFKKTCKHLDSYNRRGTVSAEVTEAQKIINRLKQEMEAEV